MKTPKALILAMAVALAPAARAADAPPTVRIENFRFQPETLEVPAGTTVLWVNGDEEIHALFSLDQSFHSPGMDTDATYAHQFTQPGTYEYRCSLHPQMKGTVVVR